MSDYERGPIDIYEITWTSGDVEQVQAHQVLWPLDFGMPDTGNGPHRKHVMLHGEVDGRWKLMLSAPVEEIHSIRLASADEPIPGGEKS